MSHIHDNESLPSMKPRRSKRLADQQGASPKASPLSSSMDTALVLDTSIPPVKPAFASDDDALAPEASTTSETGNAVLHVGQSLSAINDAAVLSNPSLSTKQSRVASNRAAPVSTTSLSSTVEQAPSASGHSAPELVPSKSVQALNPSRYYFPIDRISNEVLHMIFAYLRPKEAANARLLGTNMAVVGLQYIVSVVNLVMAQNSFNQLLDIANHPVAHQYVQELIYEVDRLEYLDQTQFADRIVGPEYAVSRELGRAPHPGVNASERALRAYRREATNYLVMPRHRFNDRQLRRAYVRYQDALIRQVKVCHSRISLDKLRRAIEKFPRLRCVSMSKEDSLTRHAKEIREMQGGFFDRNVMYKQFANASWTVGLCSTRAILDIIGRQSLPITRLSCSSLNWHLLSQSFTDFTLTKASLRHLTHLSIDFTMRKTDDYSGEVRHATVVDYIDFRCLRRRGRFSEFFSAAPDLEDLRVSFAGCHYLQTMGVMEAFGDVHWSSLRNVELCAFQTKEEDLKTFFGRHASTLQCLRFEYITLLQGTWCSTIRMMRQILKLKEAHMAGVLTESTGIHWEMEESLGVRLGDVIERYLQRHDEGDVPFEDFLANADLSHLRPL